MNRGMAALFGVALWIAGPAARAADQNPHHYLIRTGPAFRPVHPADESRPEWLYTVARGVARSAQGDQEWAVYEISVDRRVPFHHLILELHVDPKPASLFVRLLDHERRCLVPDYFGNVVERMIEPAGSIFLTVALAEHPEAAVLQILIPADQESCAQSISITPASYEILMKTAGDLVRGARAWVRTPILDSRNVRMLEDLILMKNGQYGDLISPISTFAAYGVEAGPVEAHHVSPHEIAAAFALDAIPLLLRFDVLVRQFDPVKPMEVWLNDRRVGELGLHLPDLEDPAYWPRKQRLDGWRVSRWTRGSIVLYSDGLRLGDNVVRIRQPTAASAEAIEFAEGSLQLKYPWDDFASYSFVTGSMRYSDKPVVGGIGWAPTRTAGQQEDVFIAHTRMPFRSVGINHPRPAWLREITQPHFSSTAQVYRLALNPERVPAALQVDLLFRRVYFARLTASLLRGHEMLAPNVIVQAPLDGRYVQEMMSFALPLKDYPGADTVELQITTTANGRASLERLQLKAAWPAAVAAAGHTHTEGSWATAVFDARSAMFTPEVSGPGGQIERRHPSEAPGEWYGVETRMLKEGPIPHGDSPDRYFTDFEVRVDRPVALGRVDFLVKHLCVVDGMEVFVNGRRAGTVSLHLPGLHDAGYAVFHVNRVHPNGRALTDEERYAVDYAGDIRASLVFDGALLRPGLNKVSIGRTPRLRGTNDHYTFRRVRLQLKSAGS